MAPRLTMDTIIALRGVLARHCPYEVDRFHTVCQRDEIVWPCPDATDVLKVLALPEDDAEGRVY